MKKLNSKKTILFFMAFGLFSLSAYSQSGILWLTPRETLSKIKELNFACDLTPGCKTVSHEWRKSTKGECSGAGNLLVTNALPGDLCIYEMFVNIQKYDKDGNPVCIHIRHVWGPVHCIVWD